MSAILAAVVGKLGVIGMSLAGGTGIAVALYFGKQYLPKLMGDATEKGLLAGFKNIEQINDPVERQLVRNIAKDVVLWVEYRIPDRGAGEAKFAAAAQKLCAILPFLKGRDEVIAQLIEEAVEALNDKFKVAGQK